MFSFTSALPHLCIPPSLFAKLTCLHCPCSIFHAKKQQKLPPLRFSVNKESSCLFLDGKKKGFCRGCGSGFLRRCSKDWGSEGDLALEAEILEFMKTSKNPEAFPSKKELIDAGRMDLAEAILKQGGWLASGWDLDGSDWENDNIDLGLSRRDREREWSNVVAQNRIMEDNDVGEYEEVDFFRSISSPTASSSGRSLETAAKDDSGIEGILNRLEKERNINFGFGLREKGNGTHVQTSELEHDWLAENSNHVTVADIKREDRPPSVNSKHSATNDSGDKRVNSRSISNTDSFRISFKPDMWRAWSIHRAGFSDMEFEAGEISSNATRMEGEMDASGDEKLIMREGADAYLNGRKEFFHGGISHDQIRSRLQHLELELSSVLVRLQSNTSESGLEKGDEYTSADFLKLSDAWEFQENEIMNAQDKLRSIRAKLAVLEGKMALAVIDAQKMVEEKQKRIDDARRGLRLLRTACIVWPNAATEVLLAGSFDGWTTQRKMEKSDTGVFSLYLKLYPGRYEIKFIVDGVWRVDPLRPIAHNNGYENNLLIIT